MSSGQRYTYIVRAGRFIKIGRTNNLSKRLSSLQVGCPDELLLCGLEVGGNREVALHQLFAEYHHRGEWFRHEGRLAAYIESAWGHVSPIPTSQLSEANAVVTLLCARPR